MPQLRVNGIDLEYVEHGSGEVPVVFGHGTLVSSNMWRDLYFPLLPPDWRGIALDLRGHGGSSAAEKGCTFVQMASDVLALSEALGLGRFVYVGHSMGGGVGVQLALSSPEALRGLVLLSSVTGLGPTGNAATMFMARLMARRRWLLTLMFRSMNVHRPAPGVLEKVVDEAMQVSPATLREYLSPTNRIVGVERLASLTVPTLVVIGGRDTLIPVEQQHRLAATIPGCRKVVLEAEGHVAAAERPDLVFPEIERFVANLRAER